MPAPVKLFLFIETFPFGTKICKSMWSTRKVQSRLEKYTKICNTSLQQLLKCVAKNPLFFPQEFDPSLPSLFFLLSIHKWYRKEPLFTLCTKKYFQSDKEFLLIPLLSILIVSNLLEKKTYKVTTQGKWKCNDGNYL